MYYAGKSLFLLKDSQTLVITRNWRTSIKMVLLLYYPQFIFTELNFFQCPVYKLSMCQALEGWMLGKQRHDPYP